MQYYYQFNIFNINKTLFGSIFSEIKYSVVNKVLFSLRALIFIGPFTKNVEPARDVLRGGENSIDCNSIITVFPREKNLFAERKIWEE